MTRYRHEWREELLNLDLSSKFCILVVDDMPEVVKSICELLNSIPGIETESTTEGLDAVNMVKQRMENKQMYHLILSDLTMPYDGYEIAHDIRQLEQAKKSQPSYRIYGLSSDA